MELPSWIARSTFVYAIIVDRNGSYHSVNSHFTATFGQPSISGAIPAASFIHEEDLSRFHDAIKRALGRKRAKPVGVELRHVSSPTGTVKRISWECSAHDGDYVMCIGHEVRKAPGRQQQYHSLFEQASDAIMVTDYEGNFIDVNTGMCNLFGYKREELMKMNAKQLIVPSQLAARPMQFEQLAMGMQVFSTRTMIHRDGHHIEVEANIKKINNKRVMAIARDVTALRRAQTEIGISEAKFRGAFEHSAIGMCLVALDGRWLEVNARLCHIVGYSEQEMLSMRFADITYSDDQARDFMHMREMIEGRSETYHTEKRYVHKSGNVVWVNLNVAVIRDGHGKALYFIAHSEDITGKKQAAQLMRKSEANLNTILNTCETAYALFDEHLRLVSFNNEAAKFIREQFGREPGLQESISEFLPDDKRKNLTRLLSEVIDHKGVKYESVTVRQDGMEQWYDVRLYPVYNDNGGMLGMMIAAYNMTAHKENEQKMMEHLSLLKDLSFLTSHELRHEYAKVQSAINLLATLQTDQVEQNMIISEISKSCENINNLIYKLNDKIVANRFRLGNMQEEERVSINTILLVDDDKLINYINKKLLEIHFEGCRNIHTVNDVDAALEYLKINDTNGDHLVFLDLNMPVRSGWDFLETYRDFNTHSKVIILTSSIDPIDLERSRSFSMVRNFIAKPLTRDFIRNLSGTPAHAN